MTVSVQTSSTFQAGVRVRLFATKTFGGTAVVAGYEPQYCVTADGQ